MCRRWKWCGGERKGQRKSARTKPSMRMRRSNVPQRNVLDMDKMLTEMVEEKGIMGYL